MFCHKCGERIAEGAAFCHRCGEKVIYEETAPQIFDKTKSSFHPITGQESENLGQIPANEQESLPEKEPSKFKKWWDSAPKSKRVLAALGILLASGFVLYVLVAFLREFGYLLLGIAVIGGFIVTLITGSEKEKIETRKTIVQMVIGFAAICLIVFAIVLKPDFLVNIFQPGASVRKAYLTQYSETVTVEEAFDNFFDNGKWDAYKADGYSYVVFTGACEYLGERADVKVTFKITGENFVVDRLDVNGNEQSDFILYGLLLKVYENY